LKNGRKKIGNGKYKSKEAERMGEGKTEETKEIIEGR
jgi:hypothetical protein